MNKLNLHQFDPTIEEKRPQLHSLNMTEYSDEHIRPTIKDAVDTTKLKDKQNLTEDDLKYIQESESKEAK